MTQEDQSRWASYTEVLHLNNLNSSQLADSLVQLAQLEYAKGQFSKTRELCLLANKWDPKLSITKLLIGKAYASNASLCHRDKNQGIKEDVIWAAFDEWEKIDSSSEYHEKAQEFILRYENYLPRSGGSQIYFGSTKLKEGSNYFVDCWIQRYTTIRLRSVN